MREAALFLARQSEAFDVPLLVRCWRGARAAAAVVGRFIAARRTARRRRQTVAVLRSLDDHILDDLGIDRDRLAAGEIWRRPFELPAKAKPSVSRSDLRLVASSAGPVRHHPSPAAPLKHCA